MTSQSKAYPTRVSVFFNNTQGWIVLDQIRSIDRERIIKTMEFLQVEEINHLKKIIQETYVD